MHTPILVIFVDALPFDRASRLSEELKAKTYLKSVPGAGYSINVKAEMFAGLKPDDVGYFCEWNYDSTRTTNFLSRATMSFLDLLSQKSKLLNRIFHKLITVLKKENVYDIPYPLIPYFKNSGVTAYEFYFDRPTFLSDGEFDRVLYSEEGVDDRKVFEVALNRLKKEKNKRLFVATAQLDGVMHNYGMDCEKYEDQISLIEKYAANLINEFLKIHGDEARYFLFSDHGMAPVLEGVEFNIEQHFGSPSQFSSMYFVDATFYRVWIIDKGLEEEMLKVFGELDCGHVLTKNERDDLGLKSQKHGDIIFMLDESKQFAPNFFGKDVCKAMHGYSPNLESQLGVYLSNAEGEHGKKIEAVDIYKHIKSCL